MNGPSNSRVEVMSEFGSRSGPMPSSTSPANTRAITLSTGVSTSLTWLKGCCAWKSAIRSGIRVEANSCDAATLTTPVCSSVGSTTRCSISSRSCSVASSCG